MAGVDLLYSLHFSLGYFCVILLYLYKFFAIKYYNAAKIASTNRVVENPIAYPHNVVTYYIIYTFILLCTFKYSDDLTRMVFFRTFIFFIIFIIFIWAVIRTLNTLKMQRAESEVILATLTWLIVGMNGFFFTTDLVLFLLNLEILTVVYYFFFLTYLSGSVVTLIKFKNLISNYLWISFFTLICFFAALLLIVVYCGALHFEHICQIYGKVPTFVWQLLVLAFLWKVGAPGFYFFKLEIYQYLPTASLFFFSITSVFVNCFLLYYFFSNTWVIYIYYNQFLLAYLLIGNAVLLLRGTASLTFYQFLGLSAVNTWSVLLLFFLV